MLTACFDAAGKKDNKETPIILVAGFSSIAKVWTEFDSRWSAALADFGIPHFHAGDFAHSIGPFEGFKGDEPRRRLLATCLLDIIRDCGLRKFGAFMKPKDLTKAKAAMGLANDETVDPYVLCSRSAMDDLHAFAKREGITSKPHCVFEKGDEEDLLRKHLKKHQFPDAEFRWSREVEKKGMLHSPFLGLQAAGWIAWEYYLDACRVFGLKEYRSTRETLATFESMPGNIKIPFYSNPLDDVTRQLDESFGKRLEVIQQATQRLESIRLKDGTKTSSEPIENPPSASPD